MLLAEHLYGMLAFIPAKVLAEDIWLEVAIQDGGLEIREDKQPQKVSKSL